MQSFFSSFSESDLNSVRLAFFFGIFLVMALLEIVWPKRALHYRKGRRWITNLSIIGLNSLILRLFGVVTAPLLAVAVAIWANANGWGLFTWLSWPEWLEILLAIILLDCAIYLQHVATHKIPILWRLHKVHHAEVDLDVTSGIRFHPIEILLSMVYKMGVVLALGCNPMAVILFEIVLNGTAMFNHANLSLPRWLDKVLRLVLVTPDMHRVHHSIIHRETDSNYGFALSWWDRIFRTYRAQPEKGHQNMTIGLAAHQNDNPTHFIWSLKFPFRKVTGRE